MSASSSTPRLGAVLWDMDGTLVDTEPYWIDSEYKLVAEYGGTWTDADAHTLVGSALITSARYIREVGGVPLEPEQIIDRLISDVAALMAEHTPWRPGARELLSELGAAGVPCAMVTMSYTALSDVLVAALPGDTFATVVTGDQVENGKPHPEPYATACARLGLAPGVCVAIEDSPTGLASAEAAGCVAVAVPNHVPIEPAPGRTLLPTLEGVAVADLDRLVAARAAS